MTLNRNIFWRYLLPGLCLAAVTLAVYGRILGHDFVNEWDDYTYLVGNRAVHGLTPDNILLAFSRNFFANYAPLHLVSYMLDYELWGLRPAGYLASNMLLHAANGLLFFMLLSGLTTSRAAAWAGALVFVLHPVQVESVAWISQRKNLLAMFFFLSALLCYHRYRNSYDASRRRFHYTASLVLFGCALLSKSVAVVFPAVLIMYEYCLEPGKPKRGLAIRLAPYVAVAAVFALLALWTQSAGQGGGRVPWWGGSPYATFCTMLPVLMRYLGLLFWPAALSVAYEPPIMSGMNATVVASGLGVLVLLGIGCWLFTRSRRLFFWYALFFLGLLPVSQIVPITTLMNDRYLYFPMLGAAALAGIAIGRAVEAGAGRMTTAIVAIFLAICLAWGYASYSRTAVWQNDITLWSDTVQKSPGLPGAWYGLGHSYQLRGRLDEAAGAYLRVLTLQKFDVKAFESLSAMFPGTPDFILRRTDIVSDLVRNFPAYPHGMFLLGHSGAEWTNAADHQRLFYKILRYNSGASQSLLALGNIQLRSRDPLMAARFFNQALAAGADRKEVDYNMACVLALTGQGGDALRLLERTVTASFPGRSVLEHDPYLAPLRSMPGFEKLLSK